MPKLKFFSHCAEYPPQDWCYLPSVLKLSPTVLILSPIVRNNLRSTEGIPHSTQGISTCTAVTPTVLKVSIHSTDVIPHCTEQPPQYWSYPHSTDAVPPMYWTASNVLNNLHCTEPIFNGVNAAANWKRVERVEMGREWRG